MGGNATYRYLAPYLQLPNHDTQSGGGHYFFQDIWALRLLKNNGADVHYDVGSRFDGFVGQATAICKIVCVDIRKPDFDLEGLHFVQGSILSLPFETASIHSISCLHTVEHIGLGRYGDEIDPKGFENAVLELSRILAKNGNLYLSMPIGRERVEFNAQRILSPLTPLRILDKLVLQEFSVVDDEGKFHRNVDPKDYTKANYSCGLYWFKKQ